MKLVPQVFPDPKVKMVKMDPPENLERTDCPVLREKGYVSGQHLRKNSATTRRKLRLRPEASRGFLNVCSQTLCKLLYDMTMDILLLRAYEKFSFFMLKCLTFVMPRVPLDSEDLLDPLVLLEKR